jgi:spore coat protein U-like protein
MTIVLKIAGAVSLVAFMASPGYAQSSATSTTQATTTIYQSISIANSALLSFGQVVKPTTAVISIVTVSAAGVRSLSGAAGAALGAGTVSAAAYTATGEGGQTFSISAPGFSMASGANTLAVTPILSAATGLLSGAFGAAGTGAFTVGGSFPVTNTTASGAYTGSLAVTIAYN